LVPERSGEKEAMLRDGGAAYKLDGNALGVQKIGS